MRWYVFQQPDWWLKNRRESLQPSITDAYWCRNGRTLYVFEDDQELVFVKDYGQQWLREWRDLALRELLSEIGREVEAELGPTKPNTSSTFYWLE